MEIQELEGVGVLEVQQAVAELQRDFLLLRRKFQLGGGLVGGVLRPDRGLRVVEIQWWGMVERRNY